MKKETIEACRAILSSKFIPPIQPGESISIEEALEITNCDHKKVDIQKLFPPGNGDNCFGVEVECSECSSRFSAHYSRAATIKWLSKINSPEHWECYECMKNRHKRQEAEEIDAREIIKKRTEQSTARCISLYVDPNRSWKLGTRMSDNYREMANNLRWCDPEVISSAVKALPYREFLKTPYWKAVAFDVKKKSSFKCKLCDSNEMLSAHHSNYEIHGREHEWNSRKHLICLCHKCHQKFHDKFPDPVAP